MNESMLSFNGSLFIKRIKTVSFLNRFLNALVFISLFSLLSCERDEMFDYAERRFAIGDTGPGHGIVFYVADGGLHGLEVAPAGWNGTSQDPLSAWSTIVSTAIGSEAQGTAIYSGITNTYSIMIQNGGDSSAARLCYRYSGGEKKDWYLPSVDELQAVWWNLVSDHSVSNGGRGAPHSGSLGGFSTGNYWCSTEYNNGYAWGQSFLDGYQSYMWGKGSTTLYVRPIRRF